MSLSPRGIEDLFFAASGRPDPAERAAYLDEACGRDTGLRRRIEAMLAAESRVGGFLESPAVPPPREPATMADAEGPGTLIGPYRLVEVIGEGGMGVVYLAEQERPVRRRVALKIVKPGMDTRQVVARFEAERQALALMDHPNIARVIDGGATPSGRSYFVMEPVPGVPIAEFCDRERLDVRRRVALFLLVCRAVQHAHHKGIIHRDLKPSNILVAIQDGVAVPKVIDFGIAKAIGPSLTDQTVLTGCALPIGTPRYMSPEQAEPGGLDVDTRTDIYSLGVLLYELLTGSAPSDGIRQAVGHPEPPRPSARLIALGSRLADVAARRGAEPRKLVAAVRGDLDWIAMKCLERDRTRRYETAVGLERDLRRYLADEPVEAGPPSLGYRLAKAARRHRGPMLAASGATLALVAAATVSMWQAIRATGAERRMAVALEDAERHRRLAERHLHAARLRFAGQALDAGQLDRAREILRDLESEPDGFAADEFAWGYLRARAWGALRPIGRAGEAGRYAVASPDGRVLASFDDEGPIHLTDVETSRHLAALPVPSSVANWEDVRFSADGGRLTAVVSCSAPGPSRRAMIWDIPGGRPLPEFRPPPGRQTRRVTAHPGDRLLSETIPSEGGPTRADLWDIAGPEAGPRWMSTLSEDARSGQSSADGRLWAIAESGRLLVHDLRTGARLHALGVGTRDGLAWSPSFSLDGRTLLAKSRGRVEFWDLSKGALAASRRLDGSVDEDRVWMSPDGVTVGVFRPEGTIELWDRRTGRTRTIRAEAVARPDASAFHGSRDGGKLAVLSRLADRDWRPLRIWDVATGALEATCAVEGQVAAGSPFTPDRRRVVLNRVPVAEFWEFGRATPEALAGHAAEAWAVAFSRDGRTLASGSDDTKGGDTIKLWGAADGRAERGWRGGRGTISSLAFSPDGRTLASGHIERSGSVRLWDVATGRLRAKLAGHGDRVRTVAFSPDGTRLASAGSDRAVRLWDAASGRPVATLAGHADTVREVTFSPDNLALASASNDRTVRLWDVSTGRAGRVFRVARKCSAVAFTRDGRALAAADEGGDILLWDPATGESLGTIHCDRDQLLTLAFSPDDRTLASAGSSRVIHLWDVLTGQELLTLHGHAAQINSLAFSPDGRTLASCSHDGAVKLWRSGGPRPSP